jgi:DNA-binding NarL/FixJ family response regulator
LQAGAGGFLVKSTPPEELVDLIKVAAGGHTVLSPSAARRLLSRSAETASRREAVRAKVDTLLAFEPVEGRTAWRARPLERDDIGGCAR